MPWGRIIKAISGYYDVLPDEEKPLDEKLIRCRARGIFRKKGIAPLVGDIVRFERTGSNEGWIEEIENRKNELIRPPISNMDLVVLLFSFKKPDLNLLLLDRFLAYIEYKRIPILITFTKSDLVEESVREEALRRYSAIGYTVLATSVKNGMGIEALHDHLQGKFSVFAGQSGVGKSSLLNLLMPNLHLKTGEISEKLGRGRHTTRHVELIPMNEKTFIADTPGFGQLEFCDMDPEKLSDCFPEMREKAEGCRFRECVHVKEPGCAVRSAVEREEISRERYEHYLLFLEEIKKAKERRYH